MTEKTEGMTMAQTIRPRPGRNKQYLAGYDAPKEREDIRAAKARMQGQRARYEGESFEKLLDISCEMYRMHGAARIEKTPEPMRPLSRPNSKGQFTACYVKAAQPDYKGTLAGGQAIVFEAKHTDRDRIARERVTDQQAAALDDHHQLGALTYVIVSFGLLAFYRIPWPIFRDMADRYGRKYMTREEMELYHIPFTGGYIRLLDGIAEERSGENG